MQFYIGKSIVSLPDELHQQIRQKLEERGITTAQFIEQAVITFFRHQKENQSMKIRTLAFQVSEDLYQHINCAVSPSYPMRHNGESGRRQQKIRKWAGRKNKKILIGKVNN